MTLAEMLLDRDTKASPDPDDVYILTGTWKRWTCIECFCNRWNGKILHSMLL